jgi:hypothetical protein
MIRTDQLPTFSYVNLLIRACNYLPLVSSIRIG